jgi:hypothetical protein
MQLDHQRINRPQPRVFNHSLDWRFLLPLANPEKIFVFFEDDFDFSQTLEQVGIPVLNQPSFLDIERKEKSEAASFVFPFGLPVRWVGKEQVDQIEFFRSMRQLIGDTGNLLVGFNNSWSYHPYTQTKYHSSTSRRITAQLQTAGFKSIKVLGVIPTLRIPEYIFDLNTQPIYFALQQRFKRKPILSNLIQLLSHTIGLAYLSDFLPCYFALATV